MLVKTLVKLGERESGVSDRGGEERKERFHITIIYVFAIIHQNTSLTVSKLFIINSFRA